MSQLIRHRSPSNLALVKYWGKHGRQLPNNASISFTLSAAYTETSLSYSPKAVAGGGLELAFTFEGQPQAAFRAKLIRLIDSVQAELPFLWDYQLVIDSYNSFPHSAGIASSASSMCALAQCLCTMEQTLGLSPQGVDYRQRVSYFARLFSGSACRSVYPVLASWGQHPDIVGSSDAYASAMADAVDPIFHTFRDSILLVSRQEKSVSSTAGHGLMQDHPFAAARYQQAQNNLSRLLVAMRTGDLDTFGAIVEEEALTLHGLMMNSSPSYILLEPNTLALIQRIRHWRKAQQLPVYFSLDAGPNLHLLYPASVHEQVRAMIESEWAALCEGQQWIADQVGIF